MKQQQQQQQRRGSGSAGELMGLSFVLLTVAILMATLEAVQATEFVIGGATQWTMPPATNRDFYEDWSKQQSVRVNDTLRFKYNKQQHDVIEVSEDDFDSCSLSSPIRAFNNGDTVIAMTRPGSWYFVCSYPNHCSSGQKLSIDVQNASLTGSSTTPSSSSTSPSSSSASVSGRISRKFLESFILSGMSILSFAFSL